MTGYIHGRQKADCFCRPYFGKANMNGKIECVLTEVGKVILGKETVLRKVLTAILAGGHILLDDVPGVGKTTMAVALSRTMGLEFRRIQFTPDVLPSDIVGFTLYDKNSGDFVYRPGAVSGANLLLCDEINRTSSRTQSALLEAMEERQVTVDGTVYPLQDPFLVIATQNNVGTAGTQFLPYAQVDRFMVRLSIGYPDRASQVRMLRERRLSDPMELLRCVLRKEDLLDLQQAVREVTVRDSILEYISALTEASREHEMTEIGISPRGALFLDRFARAKAVIDGRDYVTAADIRDSFEDVCAHRILLKSRALTSGATVRQVFADLLQTVRVPDRGE